MHQELFNIVACLKETIGMLIKSTDFTDKDNEMIMLFQEGDKKAFEMLYDQFAPSMLSIILRIVKDQKIAELVLSKAFMQIWQNRKSYCVQKGSIIVWLLQFARNAAFLQLEKINPDTLANFQSERQENCSLALLDLILVHGKTSVEICQILNIPQEAFAAKLKSAIQNKPDKDLR